MLDEELLAKIYIGTNILLINSDASNYRPVSLLSVVSKLLERHLHLLLVDYLNETCPLSNKQWGFQHGKSTTTISVCWSPEKEVPDSHSLLNLVVMSWNKFKLLSIWVRSGCPFLRP